MASEGAPPWALDIEGLVLHENVVTEDEQTEIVAAVDEYVSATVLLPQHWA
jgi:hypothetical protein